MALYILSDAYRKPAGCVIRIGSTPRTIAEPFAFMKEVTVKCQRNRPVVAALKMTTRPLRTAQETRETGLFSLGEPVSILAQFGEHREEIMHGFVSELKASYARNSGRLIQTTVVCQDASLRLDRDPVQRTWGGDSLIDDRSIATTILQDYGLLLDPDSGAGIHYPVLHQNDTDLRFLRTRARANGYELLFNVDNVYFGPMRLHAEPQGSIEVHRGAAAHCRRFSFQNRGRQGDAPAFHQARGELNSRYYGHVLRVGEPVEVNGVGVAHDGVYYVDAVAHRFNAQGYRQFFTLLRGAGDDDLNPLIVNHPDKPGLAYQVL